MPGFITGAPKIITRSITSTRDRIDKLKTISKSLKKGRGHRLGSFLRPHFIYLYGYGIQIAKVMYKKRDNGQIRQS